MAPAAVFIADRAGLNQGAPLAKAFQAKVTVGGLMGLAELFVTLVAHVKIKVVLQATHPVQASWCSALSKGVQRREKRWEWPRGVQPRQLTLPHKNLLTPILSALRASRVVAAHNGALHSISRDAATCSGWDMGHKKQGK